MCLSVYRRWWGHKIESDWCYLLPHLHHQAALDYHDECLYSLPLHLHQQVALEAAAMAARGEAAQTLGQLLGAKERLGGHVAWLTEAVAALRAELTRLESARECAACMVDCLYLWLSSCLLETASCLLWLSGLWLSGSWGPSCEPGAAGNRRGYCHVAFVSFESRWLRMWPLLATAQPHLL